MIFLTVGTEFPFDRLVKAVDEALDSNLINEKVFGQIGKYSYRPRNFEFVNFLEKSLLDNHMREASAIISHAGMGTITSAFERGKPLLVMPRLKQYREHVNDHQVAIVKKFEELGHLLAAHNKEDLHSGIRKLRSFVPKIRQNQAQSVALRIKNFLNELNKPAEQR